MHKNKAVKIYLLGDVIRHTFLKPAAIENMTRPYSAYNSMSGIPVLKEIIENAVINANSSNGELPQIFFSKVCSMDSKSGLITVLEHFQRKSKKNNENERRLRAQSCFYYDENISAACQYKFFQKFH